MFLSLSPWSLVLLFRFWNSLAPRKIGIKYSTIWFYLSLKCGQSMPRLIYGFIDRWYLSVTHVAPSSSNYYGCFRMRTLCSLPMMIQHLNIILFLFWKRKKNNKNLFNVQCMSRVYPTGCHTTPKIEKFIRSNTEFGLAFAEIPQRWKLDKTLFAFESGLKILNLCT